MRRHSRNQLVLDLDRGDTTMSPAPAPDGLLPALAELLLQALGKQIKAIPTRPETCDACIDIEAGLSKCDMIRTPPDFCASAIGAASASDNANAAAKPPRFRLIAHTSPGGRTLPVVGLVWRSSRDGSQRRQVTPQPIAGPSRGRVVVSASRRGRCQVRTRLRTVGAA